VAKLAASPLEWGDPTYRTKMANGVVCRGSGELVIVYYVVYEARQAVIILDVFPYPGRDLA
jgi:hypothetical protein